ncbi:uncharacterized protein LOC134680902 [Mytilus trossulus]|uniref:uncharacterized protein LOC134680902 n=1 Tax=Mytilus trossulus TaxID=6551 RepID=UPI003004F418
MADYLLYVVIDKRIHDYWFYSQELADTNFGPEEIGVALILNTFNRQIHPCLLKIVPNIYGPCDSSHVNNTCIDNNVGKHYKYNEINITPGVCCAVGATEICPILKATVKLEAHFASCIASELKWSYKFRRRFLRRLKKRHSFIYDYYPSDGDFSDIFDGCLAVPFVIEIQPVYPPQKIDYAWYYRMQGLLIKKMHLEDAMAWLSTLGGAYSSLGDYFESHAVIAGKISFKQMVIAMEMADPITISRCRLFFALSLMQQGHFKESKYIIRKQLKFAKKVVKDVKLIAMCRGLWNKVCYVMNNNQVLPQTSSTDRKRKSKQLNFVTDANYDAKLR